MKYVVLCASGAEKPWVIKSFTTLQEANKYATRQRAIQKEYHQTGHWRFLVREMTEKELFEMY